jgi:hypothetical protein
VADDFGNVTITGREIYDEIVGMRDDVRSLAQSRSDDAKTLDDHETRLRAVERWRYGIPITAIASGVAVATALVHH